MQSCKQEIGYLQWLDWEMILNGLQGSEMHEIYPFPCVRLFKVVGPSKVSQTGKVIIPIEPGWKKIYMTWNQNHWIWFTWQTAGTNGIFPFRSKVAFNFVVSTAKRFRRFETILSIKCWKACSSSSNGKWYRWERCDGYDRGGGDIYSSDCGQSRKKNN